MVTSCCRFLCYFCRISRQNQRSMFDHLSYLLENSGIGLGENTRARGGGRAVPRGPRSAVYPGIHLRWLAHSFGHSTNTHSQPTLEVALNERC